jgi:heme exporter protein B
MPTKSFAILKKDIKSEFRNKYSINSLLLFVLITTTIILFSVGLEDIDNSILAGLMWIVVFFAATSGLSRSFVSEEERGTILSLKLMTTGENIYLGKLFYNILLMLFLIIFIVIVYLFFMSNFVIRNYIILLTTILLGGIGLASSLTIIAAIISKAGNKGTLYPVLSFPILLPLLVIVIELTKSAQEGVAFVAVYSQFLLMISYSGIMITVSYLLFDFIWRD